jgi:hypothetical protein
MTIVIPKVSRKCCALLNRLSKMGFDVDNE